MFVERVLAAIDGGAPAEADALARLLGAERTQILGVLDALVAYRSHVVAEIAYPADDGTGALPAGARIGSFEIAEELGRGAMGIVYRARQLSLGNREVALKVLPQSLVARDHRFVDRFRREATLAARIHHPNLAEVYGFETVGDTLGFAMRLVEGRTLHDVLLGLSRRRQGPQRTSSAEHVRRCVMLARGLADALAEIHARGLVHRDVKPANVLLEHAAADDEEALLARPVLVDFGLLRPVGDSELTGTRTLLGTPAYASPETQLGRELDARADVFSLGATLHDLLAGTSPGTRGPATAGLPDVRSVNAAVDPRLAAIVAMALHERRELRYENGGALRDELDCWLRGEPIRALPTRAWGRLRLWIRRHPAHAARAGLASLVALLFVAFATAVGTWAFRLSATASAAAASERDGDLLGAAAAFRSLLDAAGASHLPWLADDLQRGELYRRDTGVLGKALHHLENCDSALRGGPATRTLAELEYAIANDRLCELLFSPHAAAVGDVVRGFLCRELRLDHPEFRHRIVMDTWANYLIVQPRRQDFPPELPALLRSVALAGGRPVAEPATRRAAVAALGAIRDKSVFVDLVRLLASEENDLELLLLAAACSKEVLTWVHKLDPEVYATIDQGTMESWARGYWDLAARAERRASGQQRIYRRWEAMSGEHICFQLAWHLAWWEHNPEEPDDPPRTLALPSPQLAEAVATAHQKIETAWRTLGPAELDKDIDDEFGTTQRFFYRQASGRTAVLHDARIWQEQPDAADGETAVPEPGATTGAVDFDRITADGARPSLSGTVSSARWRAAGTRAWERGAAGEIHGFGYLRLGRPGLSELRVKSIVPDRAVGLRIFVRHLRASRAVLRHEGYVAFRLRLEGQPYEFTSTAPNAAQRTDGAHDQEDADAHTAIEVPVHLLVGRPEIEAVLEYVHGNTTYRVRQVRFEWVMPPPPK